jgi:hypothetical protein
MNEHLLQEVLRLLYQGAAQIWGYHMFFLSIVKDLSIHPALVNTCPQQLCERGEIWMPVR